MKAEWSNGHLCHHTVLVTFIRKPFLLLLVLACAASLAASGRFSLRLLFDTSMTLAVIPLIQVFAFAVVYWTGRRPRQFAAAMDAFFDGFWPWFLALAVIGLFGAWASPVQSSRWMSDIGSVCAVAAVMVSARIDLRFFHDVLGRRSRRAMLDVLVHRGIGWSVTVLYFFITTAPKAGSLFTDVAANLFGIRS
jgi:hypothetical protein